MSQHIWYIITTHTYEKLIHKMSITVHRYITKGLAMTKLLEYIASYLADHKSAQKHMK